MLLFRASLKAFFARAGGSVFCGLMGMVVRLDAVDLLDCASLSVHVP